MRLLKRQKKRDVDHLKLIELATAIARFFQIVAQIILEIIKHL
ncbi:hypothetical protein Javan584_0031 [Streptococcus phage Javan584]|nr:hypothetical protein Javan584_0031 [Streptococcus phage Javan584]